MPATMTTPVSLADLTRRIAGVEGFDAVLRALDSGGSATIDGAWGSSGACAIAALAETTTLVVIAHPRDLDAWAADLHSFSGVEPASTPARRMAG